MDRSGGLGCHRGRDRAQEPPGQAEVPIPAVLRDYGHLMPSSQAEAADLLNAYLARALGGSTSLATSPSNATARLLSHAASAYYI